jgi:phosphoribosyl 1,2-cyclic phosphodiesterase
VIKSGGGWIFHFLSSGSAGNCTLVHDGREQFLIDFGLPAQTFIDLLRPAGVAVRYWRDKPEVAAAAGPTRLTAALVTHLHRDHVSPQALRVLRDSRVRLHLHRDHCCGLEDDRYFRDMSDQDLTCCYSTREFAVTQHTQARPLRLSHDSPATHGFVFTRRGAGGSQLKAGYVADLGCFPSGLAKQLADCDLLALEFNHDVKMEQESSRPRPTIERVLSDEGHLSNDQAAEALDQILRQSRKRQPRWVVLLHLSRDCNLPDLAKAAARRVLKRHGCAAQVIVTRERKPVVPIQVEAAAPAAGPPLAASYGGPKQLSLFDFD